MTTSAFSDPYNRLRSFLVKARKGAGMTQAQVADTLHKPQSYVSKYERGERRLDVIELLEVADAMGFDPSSLLKKLKQG
jgi:transcriptional regulator with XRE-family HTH domain